MWFSKAPLLLFLAAPLPACAASISCPADIQVFGVNHSLKTVDVFDGPPDELASLVPVNGVWDTKIADSVMGKYYLVCAYMGTPSKTTIPLPAQVSACELRGTQTNPLVTCR